MLYTITQTDTFEIQASSPQEAYDKFINDMDNYFSFTSDRAMVDDGGMDVEWDE